MLSTIIPRENNRTLNPLAFLKPLFKEKTTGIKKVALLEFLIHKEVLYFVTVCLFGGDRAIIAEKKVDKNEGISQYNFALSPQGAFSSLQSSSSTYAIAPRPIYQVYGISPRGYQNE